MSRYDEQMLDGIAYKVSHVIHSPPKPYNVDNHIPVVTDVGQQYSFSLERSVLEWTKAHKLEKKRNDEWLDDKIKVRNETLENLQKSSEEKAPEGQLQETLQPESKTIVSKPILAPTSVKVQQTRINPSPKKFEFSEFENAQNPFDTLELESLNDHAELANVLGISTSKPSTVNQKVSSVNPPSSFSQGASAATMSNNSINVVKPSNNYQVVSKGAQSVNYQSLPQYQPISIPNSSYPQSANFISYSKQPLMSNIRNTYRHSMTTANPMAPPPVATTVKPRLDLDSYSAYFPMVSKTTDSRLKNEWASKNQHLTTNNNISSGPRSLESPSSLEAMSKQSKSLNDIYLPQVSNATRFKAENSNEPQ